MQIRTRFAPSPTGFLHIGSARTALYCWLLARQQQGTFILRIEDTDVERSTAEFATSIVESMAWLGLDYQEGPFYQSQRFDRYHEATEILLAQDKAYRCYCSKERLEKLREAQLARKEKPRYDGHCRTLTHAPENTTFVIRFANPLTGSVSFDDPVRGNLCFQNSELDDLIIARSDGTPTYNFTVVVDDWDMKITHVIRGDDHINNTPRQINILQAFGAPLPFYAHLPMILGSDGKRLSKRHGAVSVLQYRDEGFLPEALINYLVRLGWSHGDQEIFARQELIDYFSLQEINRSPAAFNPEKLLWLNQYYLKHQDPNAVATHLLWHMNRLGIDIQQGPPLAEVVQAQSERCKTLLEMAEKSRFLYQTAINYDPELAQKHFTPEAQAALQALHAHFSAVSDWQKETLHMAISDTAAELGVGLGKVAQPLRVALTGGTVSPPIDVTVALLGKAKTLQRIENLLSRLRERVPKAGEGV